jgi:hypothetical protein
MSARAPNILAKHFSVSIGGGQAAGKRSAATRQENEPERRRDHDERCNLKQAHSFLSYARPKFRIRLASPKVAQNHIITN